MFYYSCIYIFLGECVEVNVRNLENPNCSRLFRDIDIKHVNDIKEALKRNETCFSVLVGNVPNIDRQKISLKKLKKPNTYTIETIGGNHTRKAIQELLDEDEIKYKHLEIVRCRMYVNLSSVDALRIGHEHNILNDVGKSTSAEDLVKLFRRELERIYHGSFREIPLHIIKLWHSNLCLILGLDEKNRDLHNKHKSLLALARSEAEVWGKLCRVFSLFSQKKFSNQPRGEIKTSHVKQLAALDNTGRLEILSRVLTSQNWKEMPKNLTRFVSLLS